MQAAAEAPLEHDWSGLHDSSLYVPSDNPFVPIQSVLNCFTLDGSSCFFPMENHLNVLV